MGEEFSSERHGTIFDSLRRSMERKFKNNILSSFIRYMNLTHELPVGKYSEEK